MRLKGVSASWEHRTVLPGAKQQSSSRRCEQVFRWEKFGRQEVLEDRTGRRRMEEGSNRQRSQPTVPDKQNQLCSLSISQELSHI